MVRQAFLGLAAAFLALVFAVRLADGSMGFLVQTWYVPILLASTGVLAVLAAVVSWQAVRAGGRWRVSVRPSAMAGAVLIAAPIVLGLVMTPRPLGSASLDDANATSGVRQFTRPASAAEPAQRNVYQWAYEFANSDPRELIGQGVDIVGFVYHGKDEAAGTFQVARFVVACCVADATGALVPVQWQPGDTLPADGWVHVQGTVASGPAGALVVQASSVDRVEAPSNPYIYP